MKERLTKKDEYGHWYTNSTVYDRGMTSEDGVHYEKHYLENGLSAYDGEPIDRLAEYEDLEEQGLIKRFPCNVGDAVYSIWGGLGQDQTVKADTVWHFTVRDKVYITTDYIEEGELGVDVFLTHEDAEKKLAEFKGE